MENKNNTTPSEQIQNEETNTHVYRHFNKKKVAG
jgi:hypothetical protein